MKIRFKKGNYYFCTKDYIINQKVAFKKNHSYECMRDNILKGHNNEVYCFGNTDVEKDSFILLPKKENNITKKENNMNNKIEHPKHYSYLKELCGIEVIDITRHMDFCLGNAIKYILRAGHKQEASMSNKEKEIEDLKKAIFYINDRIAQIEGKYDKIS